MLDKGKEEKSAPLEHEVRDMKIEESQSEEDEGVGSKSEVVSEGAETPIATNGVKRAVKSTSRSASHSPVKVQSASELHMDKPERGETVSADTAFKTEPGQAPKLSRTTSHKMAPRAPMLHLDAPDKMAEASETFQVIEDCIYAAKYIGNTEHALECDCTEEWGMCSQLF